MSQPCARWLAAVAGLALAVGVRGQSPEPERAETQPANVPQGRVIEGIVLNYNGGGVQGADVRIESPDASAEDEPLARTSTNQYGDIAFRIPASITGVIRVRIRAEGFTEWLHEVNLDEIEGTPFIDATMEGATRLAGTLGDRVTGDPVAEAMIRCENGGRTLESTSDAEGAFAVENLYEGQTTVTVVATGYGIHREMFIVESREHRLDLELLPERPVELTLRTNRGKPADDVLVEAIVMPMSYYVYARSDAEGRVTLTGVSPEAIFLQLRFNGDRYVHMPGYDETLPLITRGPVTSRSMEAPKKVEAELTVTAGSTVAGKVVQKETGEPILGVRVIAGSQATADKPMTWTDSDGSYTLHGVRPGIVTVSFQHANYATSVHEADLYTGKTFELDTKLTAGEPIQGVVVDSSGAPLDGVWVTATRWRGYTTLALRAVTNDKGEFTLAHAPPGEVECTFSKPGVAEPVTKEIKAGTTDCKVTLEVVEYTRPGVPDVRERMASGQAAPEMTLTMTDGQTIKLSELRGKYVFIDCWASWCRPCVAEIPHVKELHETMKDRADFMLIGISLDHNRSAFMKAVKEHGVGWPQAMGEQSGAREAFEALEGSAIPYTCLIGPDGKILAQHLRGPGLTDEVLKLLARPAETAAAD